MKRIGRFKTVLTFVVATSLLVGIVSATALSVTDENISISSTAWKKISEEYYAPILVADGGQVLLRKTLQQSDFEQILEALVDTSIPADTAAVAKAATDPDAHLPDNMLPDGRVLRSDWQEVQQKLIASAQKMTKLSDGKMVSTTAARQMALAAEGVDCKMNVFSLDGQQYIIPETGMSSCKIIPDRNESIFYNNQGIWLVNPKTQQSSALLPNEYNGKTYDELYEQAAQKGNTNGLVWNNQVCVNDAGTKLAYISDKENLLTYSVFMYDLETGKEKLVRVSEDHNYVMIGWIDDDTVLCYKLRGEGLSIVAIDASGNEQAVALETNDPYIIDISGNLIAYRGPGSSDVWISKYNGTTSTELVKHIDLKDGVICVMAGADEFNPTGDKFAFIYSPNSMSQERYLWTIDLVESKINKEMTLPAIESDTIGVHNFSWKNSNELIVNVYAQESAGNETISTWNYTVRGGNQDVSY